MDSKRHKRSARFTRTLLVALGITGICWGILYAVLGHYSEDDKIVYDRMINREGPDQLSETQVSKQDRRGLQKSVFIDLGEGRQEFRMQSAYSELALEKTERHVEIVEHLHDMTGWIQESVYYLFPDGRKASLNEKLEDYAQAVKEQILLRLKAKEAIYHYKDGRFNAENFTFERYIFPGHTLDVNINQGKLIAEGTAAVLKSSLTDHGIEMTVETLDLKSLQEEKEGALAISADHASYNGEHLLLEGNASVSYKNSILSAGSIDLTTKKHERFNIQNIIAEGNVEMKDYFGLNAAADKAVFIRSPEHPETNQEFLPGTITLSMHSPEQLCHVTNLEGDDIKATSIVIDTISEDVIFAAPFGTLKNIRFSADKMTWNESGLKLILSGNVKIDDPSIGKLQAINNVNLVLSMVDGKKILRGMETEGEAVLTYIDSQTGLNHLLKSYGAFRVNHQKMEAKLLSPENSDGSVAKDKQVYFEDAKGIFYADKVFLKYQESGKKIALDRIVLNGNVKIANFFELSAKNKTTINQYILADRVDFIPQTNQMIFKASKGRRVLFFDEGNSLQVSAPGLQINRDKAARKDTIKGLGDVRFSFVESELDQFRHHFPLKRDK